MNQQMKNIQRTKQTGSVDGREDKIMNVVNEKFKSLSIKVRDQITDIVTKGKSDVATLEKAIEAIKTTVINKEAIRQGQDQIAKKDMQKLIELKTGTLEVQYDQIRSDYNAFREETEHTMKNLVKDVGKLHRTMAKVDSKSKDSIKSIETL